MMTDPPDEPTDAAIVAASLHDPPSYGAIFDRHADVVHRYLQRRVGRDRADDLLGEVFRISFERRATYRVEHASARPWLFGIATNLVFKEHRREARCLRALARLPVAPGALDEALQRVDEVLDASGEAARVVQALLALDPRDRDVVVLIAWEGFTYVEVAQALDVPVGTVRSRLNRARRQLRERELQLGRGDDRSTNTMTHEPREVVCE